MAGIDKKVGIIGAMDIEVKMLREELVDSKEIVTGGLVFVEGKLNNTSVVIVKSGIGKVNAALCTQLLVINFGVTHVVNTGIAGAMASGLKVLDFVVSEDALYHDFDTTGFGYKPTVIPQMDCSDFKADPKMIEAALAAFKTLKAAEGHSLVTGRIASGDQFISSKEQKEKIRSVCNPACVEMEGTAIAHACYINKVPFAIIRCMSDMADDNGENIYNFNEEEAACLSASLVKNMLPLF